MAVSRWLLRARFGNRLFGVEEAKDSPGDWQRLAFFQPCLPVVVVVVVRALSSVLEGLEARRAGGEGRIKLPRRKW